MTAENEYIRSATLEHRKKFAQFFTPPAIAKAMAEWLLGNDHLESIQEPAFGLGIFSRMLLKEKPHLRIDGFDIDDHILTHARHAFAGAAQVNLQLRHYLRHDWANKYDGIICNPPYFKFHDYDNKRDIQEIQKHLGYKLSGFTNLYTLFLLKSIHQLAEDGRCAYIVPSEFLNADYGVLVKSHLLASGTLRHVIVFDFEENVFQDALTTAAILLMAKDKHDGHVGFTKIRSMEELHVVEKLIRNYPMQTGHIFTTSEISPEVKWKTYYQPQKSLSFKHLTPFRRFAKVTRGIATGANAYFTFNQEKAEAFGIGGESLIPCICHATDIRSTIFAYSDFETLKENGKKVYLFSPKEPFGHNVSKYLEKGKEERIDQKYLTSSRNPWYATERRNPAPIWVSVFNRTGMKFIRNTTNTLNLTTFHGVYMQNDMLNDISVDLLFAYLLTDTAKEILADNSREYGNGLQKFEPNDLNKGMVLNLTLLPTGHKQKIYTSYDQYVKNRDSSHIATINQLLIDFYKK